MSRETFPPIRLHDELERLLELVSPSTILCVGEPAARHLAPAVQRVGSGTLSTVPLADIPRRLSGLSVYDLAYVHGAVERLPRTGAGMLLARLRDVSARHLVVHVEIGAGWPGHTSNWESNDLLAYGLIKAGEYLDGDRRAQIYQFNISEYKLTPEWCNPRHWAHPHLWRP